MGLYTERRRSEHAGGREGEKGTEEGAGERQHEGRAATGHETRGAAPILNASFRLLECRTSIAMHVTMTDRRSRDHCRGGSYEDARLT